MNTFLTMLFSVLTIPSSFRMMVISDPHVLDSTLFDVNAPSMRNKMADNLNQNEYAQAAFIQLVDQALKDKPDVVLIPGDMTMSGERVSHQAVVDQLHRLTEQKIKVCLIPGNHDINNDNAAAYLGEEKVSVPSINDAEFDAMYADFNAAYPGRRQDPNSHSYVVTLAPRLTLIGVDCSRGDIDGLTLDWILAQADSAVAKFDRVIAMMHYQLLEPTDNYAAVIQDALVDDAEEVAKAFRQHGIELVLTGHMHINNVTTNFMENGDSIVDVSTGTPIMYPNSYRMITLTDTCSQFSCQTERISQLKGVPAFTEDSNRSHVKYTLKNKTLRGVYDMAWENKDKVDSAIDDIKVEGLAETLLGFFGGKDGLKTLAHDLINQIPSDSKQRADYINGYVGEDATKMALVHIEGNEWEKDTEDIPDDLFEDVQNLLYDLIDKAYPKWYHFTYRGELKLAVSTALSKVKDMDKVQDFFDGFFGDYTNYKKDDQNRTDDLRPTLSFAQLPHRDYYATVYYDVRGKGEDFVESVLINEPTMITRPKDPVFDGWKFVEWYVDEELTQAYDFATVIDTTDDVTIRLYAKWMMVITFTLGDVEKKYDGTPIEILYKYKGSLPKSCVVSVEVDTMLVDAGEVVYHVTRTGIWNGTTEVTNNYVIEWTIDSASMRVTKRWMEITTATDSMAYNGTALTAEDTTMVGDGWVDGEGIDMTFTGEQTEEGMSENTMEYEPWEGTNLANYDIQVVYGWLIVTPEEKPTWLVVPKKMEETEKVWLNNRLLIRKGNRLYDVCGQEW